jgi:hypothetical protein
MWTSYVLAGRGFGRGVIDWARRVTRAGGVIDFAGRVWRRSTSADRIRAYVVVTVRSGGSSLEESGRVDLRGSWESVAA